MEIDLKNWTSRNIYAAINEVDESKWKAIQKIKACPFSVKTIKECHEIRIGEEQEVIGSMGINQYSPDGWYSYIQLRIEGREIYNEIRRSNGEVCAAFVAVQIRKYLAVFGHFKIGSFDSRKYYLIPKIDQ